MQIQSKEVDRLLVINAEKAHVHKLSLSFLPLSTYHTHTHTRTRARGHTHTHFKNKNKKQKQNIAIETFCALFPFTPQLAANTAAPPLLFFSFCNLHRARV